MKSEKEVCVQQPTGGAQFTRVSSMAMPCQQHVHTCMLTKPLSEIQIDSNSIPPKEGHLA